MKDLLLSAADELAAVPESREPRPTSNRRDRTWLHFSGRFFPNRRSFVPWLLPASLLIAWTVSTETGWVHPLILPKPTDVLAAAIDLSRTRLPSDLLISTERAFSGLALGGGVALVLGFIAGLSRLGGELLDTTMHMKRTIPSLAIMPLLIIWFGVGENMKIVLIASGVFFPVYINTYYGMRSIDPALVEVGRVYGLSGWTLFRKVILPGALPWIFVGLRFALGAMWLVLIVAETVGTSAGIGFITNTANEFMQTDVVLVIVLLYAFLGKAADLAVRWLEHFFLPWHHAYGGPGRPKSL